MEGDRIATDKSPGVLAGQGYPGNRDMERSPPGAVHPVSTGLTQWETSNEGIPGISGDITIHNYHLTHRCTSDVNPPTSDVNPPRQEIPPAGPLKRVPVSRRVPYQTHQRIYNVGIRLVMDD